MTDNKRIREIIAFIKDEFKVVLDAGEIKIKEESGKEVAEIKENVQYTIEVTINGKPMTLGYQSWTGPCWWCSNQMANLSSYTWYDPYYRYNNTCSCQWVPGCGKSGYVRNAYHCKSYPTLYISSVTNRFGVTTYTEYCSAPGCGYYYSYTFG